MKKCVILKNDLPPSALPFRRRQTRDEVQRYMCDQGLCGTSSGWRSPCPGLPRRLASGGDRAGHDILSHILGEGWPPESLLDHEDSPFDTWMTCEWSFLFGVLKDPSSQSEEEFDFGVHVLGGIQDSLYIVSPLQVLVPQVPGGAENLTWIPGAQTLGGDAIHTLVSHDQFGVSLLRDSWWRYQEMQEVSVQMLLNPEEAQRGLSCYRGTIERILTGCVTHGCCTTLNRKALQRTLLSTSPGRGCHSRRALVFKHLHPLVSPNIDPLQFAYHSGIGVDDGVIYRLQISLSHLEYAGNTVRITFFDFSSAFNTIHPSLLRVKLERAGASDQLAAWVTNYLTDRTPVCEAAGLCVRCGGLQHRCPPGNSPLTFPLHLVHIGLQCQQDKGDGDRFQQETLIQHCTAVNIQGVDIERVRTYKYLGVHI
ncbi:hypothetical protein L3Q82_005850 [Scortum barcoo]|uniref:Uncharacterized protein n=1 Tax=Scortum barcoo TaxID=214431 RepID=A0ACB8V6U6_9TELE|nr:hypothetical protein L3Q82_005850 [Scortum barcoo]